jgi:hypothetical protein
MIADWDPCAYLQREHWEELRADYKHEVVKALVAAMEDVEPDEMNKLCSAWDQICESDTEFGKTEGRLIQVLAPVFKKRGLHPAEYFTRQLAA